MNNILPEVSRGNSINRNFDLNPSSYIEANAQYCSCIVVTESTGWHKPYFASPHSLYILLWFSPHHPPLLVVLLYLILRISITINSTCTCTSNTIYTYLIIVYIFITSNIFFKITYTTPQILLRKLKPSIGLNDSQTVEN